MSTDLETKVRSALDRGKPLIEAVIADLEREATLIRERDLDPRKLADEPRVQEARSSAVDALEQLTAFAKSLDGLVKSYSEQIDKRIDVDKIKEQIAAAPAAGRSLIDDRNGHGTAERIKSASEDAKEKVVSETDKGNAKIDSAAQAGKETAAEAAHKAKQSTKEMVATLGWVAAAGTVVYVVFMDEKRRRQAKSVAKAAGNGLLVVVNSASKKS
jgi:hypothetical protein